MKEINSVTARPSTEQISKKVVWLNLVSGNHENWICDAAPDFLKGLVCKIWL